MTTAKLSPEQERVALLRIASRDVHARRADALQAQQRLTEAIHKARASGMTLQAIGDVLGLTRQRVKQLLDKETS